MAYPQRNHLGTVDDYRCISLVEFVLKGGGGVQLFIRIFLKISISDSSPWHRLGKVRMVKVTGCVTEVLRSHRTV